MSGAQPPPPAGPRRRRVARAADVLPVWVLAVIAGAGSFTHIRDTAAQHGQRGPMAWAVAVCIDLTCLMAARERQRDKRLGVAAGRLSWPALVLAGGAGLSLAANLAQAQPTAWGRITAAVPAGAFLVAVSMIERRAARPAPAPDGPQAPAPVPPLVPDVPDGTVPAAAAAVPEADEHAVPSPPAQPPAAPAGDVPDEALLAAARRAAAAHQAEHGRPVSRDALRARLGVSNQAASALLRQLRSPAGPTVGSPRPPAGHDRAPPARAPSARAPPPARRAARHAEHRAGRPPPSPVTGPRSGRHATVRRNPGPGGRCPAAQGTDGRPGGSTRRRRACRGTGSPVGRAEAAASGHSAGPSGPGSFPYSCLHRNTRDRGNVQAAARRPIPAGSQTVLQAEPVKRYPAPSLRVRPSWFP